MPVIYSQRHEFTLTESKCILIVMATLLLTSTGISSDIVRESFLQEVDTRRDQHIAIITNAAQDGKENKYARLAEQQFRDLGFSSISFVDVETEQIHILDEADIIYVMGGNTFTLLKKIRESGADKILSKRLSETSDLIYIGVSAGSILLTPTVRLANEVEPDPNDEGIDDFSGLSFFPDEIYPHYTEDVESEIREYEIRHSVSVRRITNDEAILVKNGNVTNVS